MLTKILREAHSVSLGTDLPSKSQPQYFFFFQISMTRTLKVPPGISFSDSPVFKMWGKETSSIILHPLKFELVFSKATKQKLKIHFSGRFLRQLSNNK